MIIGVVIQFTFSSLIFNEDILAALENEKNFQLGLIAASIVVFLFIIFFILYANTFFMNQRKKEFGMYLLYGMSERQIAFMVFIETLILGSISLIIGILAGGLLSKLSGMLLMNLMQYDEMISFTFPLEAIGSTIVLFMILIGIISVQSYFSVRHIRLVELFHSGASLEKLKPTSKLLALLSILLLGVAFLLISRDGTSILWEDYRTASSIAMTIGIVGGTYLFFRQFSGWILEIMSRGRRYNEGNRVLWTSSLRFSVRGNALNLTSISLFSAAIIILTGFVAINYAVQIDGSTQNFPNDIAFESQDKQTLQQIEAMLHESDHPIITHETIEGVLAEPVTNRDVAFEQSDYFTEDIVLFSETQFNDIAALRGEDQEVELHGQEAVVLSKIDTPKQFTQENQAEFTVTTETGEAPTLYLTERKDYALLGPASNLSNTNAFLHLAIFVISDEAYATIRNSRATQMYELYQIENARHSAALSEQVQAIISPSSETYYSAFVDDYTIQVESSALLLFTAAFLAVIAVFALGSIIYFKQLREATDEQKQYATLRKIGVSNHEMKRVIRKKLVFVFLPPFILGALHSLFIMNYSIFEEVRDFPQLTAIMWSILIIYFVIYCLFYVSSTSLYYKIVNQ
jgi:putative ABC transport system permease protein